MAKKPRAAIKGPLGDMLKRDVVSKAKKVVAKAMRRGRNNTLAKRNAERIASPRTNKGKKK